MDDATKSVKDGLMNDIGLSLAVLFFSYSFLGWLLETSIATIKNKVYGNRGFVSGPFCFIYGFSAIFMTVFLNELKGNPFFLFLGASIVATVIEWFTGKALERIGQKRWWNYLDKRWNIDGYICFSYSVIWGILGCVAVYWANDIMLGIFAMLPDLFLEIGIWCLCGISAMDIMASVITVVRGERKTSGLLRWNQRLENWTIRFGNAITSRIQKRIEKAYPRIDTVKEEKSEERLSYGEFIWLFVIGAFLGDIVETIYCRITTGMWMSRSSLVWGPFSIVWGLALALVTGLLYKDREKPDRYLFMAGTFLGGAYEYICSVFTEIAFGKVFWDYSDIPFNLGGRINLLYCFFWGIAAVVWFKVVYPKLDVLVKKIMKKTGKLFCALLVIFLLADIGVSVLALVRYDARERGRGPQKQWEKTIDEHFPDERMKRIYPNAM